MNAIFSKRLHTLRFQQNLSQKELAVSLHVSAATMSNYENGINLPPFSKAIELAGLLHCSLDYLSGITAYNVHPKLMEETISLPQHQDPITFYQFLKLISQLPPEERTDLYLYYTYLYYKQTTDLTPSYDFSTTPLQVAEEHAFLKKI